MNKEEYIKIIENNEETNQYVEMLSTLTAVIDILIKKNVCTGKELDEEREICRKYVLNESYKKEKKEDLETIKTFMDIFGGINGFGKNI